MTSNELPIETLVAARLKELVDHRTPWQRSLWQVGTVLALKEVLEYAEGVRSKAIRGEALDFVTSSVCRLVGRDLGLGTGDLRGRVLEILSYGAKKEGVLDLAVADSLHELIPRIERDYLQRWVSALEVGAVTRNHVELMARSVVAHLLDAGFAGDHLHGWWTRSLDEGTSLHDLMAKAIEMFERDPVDYEVLVPFTHLPREIAAIAGVRFLTPDELDARLKTEGLPLPKLREGTGTLRFHVSAREPKAALEKAEIEVRRLTARVAVGLPPSNSVVPAGKALAIPAARPRWRDLSPRRKALFLPTMMRHRLLLPAESEPALGALDDSFELLATVGATTSWASVATLWAAVEGLLARPGDSGVTAADRLAAVVAGGLVRAELTQLVDVLARGEGSLGDLLRSDLSSQERMDAVLGLIERGDGLELDDPADEAAVERIKMLLAAPSEVMTRMTQYFADAFRRLFNQRNLLLHGGRFDSVVLPATMRTVPALVAAGLDRIVYAAAQSDPTNPFGLAARAQNEIELLGTADARAMDRLLE